MGSGLLSRKNLPHTSSWARLPGAGLQAALELIFPPACAGCSREMTPSPAREGGLSFCEFCLSQLVLFTGPACRKCGAPVPGQADVSDSCIRCRRRRLWFDETVALGDYAGHLRELVLQMKNSRGNATSLAMAQLLWHHRRGQLEALRPDVATAVPMHWRRRWTHGTNSAALLAEVVASRLGVRHAGRLMHRRLNTPPQFSLPPSKRWQNVRQAFAVKKSYPIQGAHVLLVDDIMTTGATCSEAARMLKTAGAERVSVVVAARTLVH
jgi:ComF family protein